MAAVRSQGARNASSWAHSELHGKRCFDAKLEKLERVAKKHGLQWKRPVSKEEPLSAWEAASFCGSLAVGLGSATWYVASWP